MDREFVISQIRRVAKLREPCPGRCYSRVSLRNSSLSGCLAAAFDAKFGPGLRLMLYVVVATAIMATTLAEPAYAQDSAVYLAIYVDVMPNEKVSGAALLERYRDASRKEDGNLRFEVLHEIGRPARFAMLEVWKDKAALETHDRAASSLRFRERLNAIRSAPYDVRVHSGIYVGPPKTESRVGTIMCSLTSTSFPTTGPIAWHCSRSCASIAPETTATSSTRCFSKPIWLTISPS